MSQDKIYVRDLEDICSLPQAVQEEILRLESLGYQRRHLVVSHGKVHYFPELDHDDSFAEACEERSHRSPDSSETA